MSKAQDWAQQRFVAKGRVTSVMQNLKNLTKVNYLLATERAEIRRAVLLLKETLGCWKARTGLSKKKFMEGNK